MIRIQRRDLPNVDFLWPAGHHVVAHRKPTGGDGTNTVLEGLRLAPAKETAVAVLRNREAASWVGAPE